jgi:hypothetical protein
MQKKKQRKKDVRTDPARVSTAPASPERTQKPVALYTDVPKEALARARSPRCPANTLVSRLRSTCCRPEEEGAIRSNGRKKQRKKAAHESSSRHLDLGRHLEKEMFKMTSRWQSASTA